MEITYILLLLLAVVVGLFILSVIYFQIYKHHINKVLVEPAKKHIRMTPPYKMIMAFVIILIGIVIALAATIMPSLNRITTASEIEKYTRNFQAVSEDWDIEIAMNNNLAAALAYDVESGKHTFSIYENKNETFTNYVFRYGGKSTSIERSVRVFIFDNSIALLSMNELHISKIECHDGETYELNPNEPFALVMPNDGFDVYGADGNKIDLKQAEWYEQTERK